MAQPYLELDITNPTPSGGQPNAVYNEVWRSEVGATGPFIRLKTGLAVGANVLYKDYGVASGKTYWYFVRTYFDNATTVDNAAATGVNTWADYSWLGLPDGTAPVQLRWNPERKERFRVESRLLDFDGRKYPLGFAGAGTSDEWDLGYMLQKELDGSPEQADALKTLVDTYRGRTLMWRDPMGNLVYCWCDGYDRTLERNPRSDVSFLLSRVDFSPAV